MERNTLKGTVKVSSYILTFILMVGIHVAMDKIGTNKSPVTNVKAGVHSAKTDDNLVRANLLQNDSLQAIGNKIEKTQIENRD